MSKIQVLLLVSLSAFSLSAKANFLERIPVSADEVEICEMPMKIKVSSSVGPGGFTNENIKVKTLIARTDSDTVITRLMINPDKTRKGQMDHPGQTDEVSVFNVPSESIETYTFMHKPTKGQKERKWAEVTFDTDQGETTGTVSLIRSKKKKYDKGLKGFPQKEKDFINKFWSHTHFDNEWDNNNFEQPWYDEYHAAEPVVRDSSRGTDSTILTDTPFMISAYNYVFSFLRLAEINEESPRLFHIGKRKNGPNDHIASPQFTQLPDNRIQIQGSTKLDAADADIDVIVNTETKLFEKFLITAKGKTKAGPITVTVTATWSLEGEQTCSRQAL